MSGNEGRTHSAQLTPEPPLALEKQKDSPERATQLILHPSRRLLDAQQKAVASVAALGALLCVLLAGVGILPPGLAATILPVITLAAAALFALMSRNHQASCLEIMPGLARHSHGAFTHKETLIRFDSIVAATVVQGPLERYLARTATLELTFSCASGLLRVRIPGMENASVQRQAVMTMGQPSQPTEEETPDSLLSQPPVHELLNEMLDQLKQLRERMERW